VSSRARVLLTALVAAAAALPAQAGLRKCASHTITGIDARNAMGAARRVAGTSRLTDKGLTVCMNLGRGLAWFQAEPEPQSDGSEWHPSVDCERETGRWRCKKEITRTLPIEVSVNGADRTFVFGIPNHVPAETARALARKAYAVAPQLEVSQTCDYQPGVHSFARAPEWLAEMKTSYARMEPSFWQRIDVHDGTASVDVNNFVLNFRRASPDAEWEFTCWDMEIVVT
jgi:hypothetical protein